MLEFSVPDHLPDFISSHVKEYLDSNGEDCHLWQMPGRDGPPMTALLLVTKGRKSGKAITLPLVYGEADGGYVIIASKAGAPTHPAWYLNLEADPNVAVMVGPDQFASTARITEGEERQKLWDMMATMNPGYNDYVEKAQGREIPVVVLEKA